MNDPQNFPDPTTFNPDRYEGSDKKRKPVHDLVFGFGRRYVPWPLRIPTTVLIYFNSACPGVHLAENNLLAFFSTILATCEIRAPKDEAGNDILPGMDFTSGSIAYAISSSHLHEIARLTSF